MEKGERFLRRLGLKPVLIIEKPYRLSRDFWQFCWLEYDVEGFLVERFGSWTLKNWRSSSIGVENATTSI